MRSHVRSILEIKFKGVQMEKMRFCYFRVVAIFNYWLLEFFIRFDSGRSKQSGNGESLWELFSIRIYLYLFEGRSKMHLKFKHYLHSEPGSIVREGETRMQFLFDFFFFPTTKNLNIKAVEWLIELARR